MLNRRNFLFTQTALFNLFNTGNLTFANTLPSDDGGVGAKSGDNAIIYLFLSGGMTHIESFNPCPLAPAEIRSVCGHLPTTIPGEVIGGLHHELAKRTNKVAIVRSFGHKDSNHRSAQHLNLTGGKTIGDNPQQVPSFGSVASYKFGPNSNNGMPHYIKLNSHAHIDGATLGSKYNGYDASPEGVGDLTLKISNEKFLKRQRILDSIEGRSPIGQMGADYIELRKQAIDSLTGNIADAFKLDGDSHYEKFKGNKLGEDLLRSIRLVEAGSKFVFLTTGGWDMHNNILQGLQSLQVPLDLYLGKMLDTLTERGLNKRVLFIVSSEFGRTFKVNSNAGRDHQSSCIPLLFACDSYEMGRVIGKTNSTANEVIDSPFDPNDLTNTILSHIGISKSERWVGIDGRPHDFIDSNSKNILTGI